MTNKIELQVLERDNYTCRKCGNQSKYLTVEPIYIDWEISDLASNELMRTENYLTLCANCGFIYPLFSQIESILGERFPKYKLTERSTSLIRYYLNEIGSEQVFDAVYITKFNLSNQVINSDDFMRYFFGVCAKKKISNFTELK